MHAKRLLIFLATLTVLSAAHVGLNLLVFPQIEKPAQEIIKHIYDGISLGIYTGVVYLIDYLTRDNYPAYPQEKSQNIVAVTRPLFQAIVLALLLFLGLRIIQALINILITVFDDLRVNGEVYSISEYGMSVIVNTLSGYLFFFSWIPFCIFLVLRLTRKIDRNPGFKYFFIVAALTLFATIFVNYQTTNEWAKAFVGRLGPIFGSSPKEIYPRDVALFVTIQTVGTLALSFLLGLVMWSVSALRMRLGRKLDKWGI